MLRHVVYASLLHFGVETAYRKPSAALQPEIVEAITQPGKEPSQYEGARKAICDFARMPPNDLRQSSRDNKSLSDSIGNIILEMTGKNKPGPQDMECEIKSGLQDMKCEIKPGPSVAYHHLVISLLRQTLEGGVPPDDLSDRISTARKIIRAIDDYLPYDPNPRWLFLNQGELSMDLAWAAHDALALPSEKKFSALCDFNINFDDKKPCTFHDLEFDSETANKDQDSALNAKLQTEIAHDLRSARVGFENALHTKTPAPLVEPSSDIDPLTRLGDALLAVGDVSGAQDAYARAVDVFSNDYEPLNDLVLLARATAHWATSRAANHGCDHNMTEDDGTWEKHWGRLGAHDICAFDRPEDKGDRASLIHLIYPLVADAVNECKKEHFNFRETPKTEDSQPEEDKLVNKKMIDCLRAAGPDKIAVRNKFELAHAGSTGENEIDSALNRRP